MSDFGITICDSIAQMSKRASNRVAVKFKSKSKWIQWSWSEYYDAISALGLGLLEYQVQPGQRVGIISSSRLEWAITDAALMALGAVSVPIYPTLTPEDVDFIIKDTGLSILVIEDRFLLKQLQSRIGESLKTVKHIILFEKVRSQDQSLLSWRSILDNGRQLLKYRRESFELRLRDTRSSDIATIIYTSGTSGLPKGVVITHTQIMSELTDTFALLGVSPDDISLSFLPFSHVLGRVELWGHWYVGFQMCFAESQERLRHNMLEINPTILMAVPRVFEKVYALALSQIEGNWITNSVFKSAFQIQKILNKLPDTHMSKSSWKIISGLLLNQIKGLFGNRLRFAVCGGSRLDSKITDFFLNCGVLILEGYGLTETTGAVTVNRPFEYEIGTVGKPIGDVQIRLDLDGEILVRSKKVMSKYLNSENQWGESTQDGWFRTGDLGEWTEKGNLKIIDRKKDLIKTSSGKYISPQKLILKLKRHPWISQVHISGDEKKFAVALITLNQDQVLNDLNQEASNEDAWIKLSQSQSVQNTIKVFVTQVNSELSSFETIKRFAILPQEFSIAGGEMTQSLKLKTKYIESKYQAVLHKLYLT